MALTLLESIQSREMRAAVRPRAVAGSPDRAASSVEEVSSCLAVGCTPSLKAQIGGDEGVERFRRFHRTVVRGKPMRPSVHRVGVLRENHAKAEGCPAQVKQSEVGLCSAATIGECSPSRAESGAFSDLDTIRRSPRRIPPSIAVLEREFRKSLRVHLPLRRSPEGDGVTRNCAEQATHSETPSLVCGCGKSRRR
jgi:hypothetical protein